MRPLAKISLVLLVAALGCATAHGRGGGGCIEQGSAILTPGGPVPIEQLRPGDKVLAVAGSSGVESEVQAVTSVEPTDYVEIAAAGQVLRLTAEHPVEIEPGVFRMAKALRAGDLVRIQSRGGIAGRPVQSVRQVPAEVSAYNLLVAPAGTYFANGLVVHNKGCFLPDTIIRTETGVGIPISAIRAGDRVMAFAADGSVTGAVVREVLVREVGEYRIVKTGAIELHVTAEHPFYVGNSTFKTLDALKVGDTIYAYDGEGLRAQSIESIQAVAAKTRVYNLQTDWPNTFFADGVAVHNKGGGCFARGTMIRTPGGDIPIERIKIGDRVTAITESGQAFPQSVKETHATHSPLVVFRTAAGSLRTTTEHPIALAGGGFREAGKLTVGDRVLAWREGKTVLEAVTLWMSTEGEEEVFNLTVDEPHTFVADSFVVHNKGGGGFRGGGGYRGSRSSRGGSGGSDWGVLVMLVVIIVFLFVSNSAKTKEENLDFVFSPSAVAGKSGKTVKLLEFISKQDPVMAPEALRKQAEATFRKLQECWQAREYDPMKPLLMPDLYQDHSRQIAGMIRNHEIDVIGNLRIDRIDLVNVRYTAKENQREFTALITATARDYYVDDRTRSFIRGDSAPAQFQEFWTFQRLNGAWLLREIEQTRESNVLKEDNFFEPFTEGGVQQVYGDEAAGQGQAGGWLEQGVAAKETRIDRLLNFLVQTDKLWNRALMLEATRRVFLEIMAVWESGNAADVPVNDVFPEVAAHLSGEISKNREQGITAEFRNLCVRKVEFVLVRNFSDNRKDEFVARVRAHAQRVVRQRGQVSRQDADVTPFEQYLTMGRLDGRWRLKEMLSAEAGRGAVSQENLDQDSGPGQLQWYYQHKRAG